jgi:hypothetical protein
MEEKTDVIITDIQMPFLSMVWFIFKWTVAAIPALTVAGLFLSVLFVFLVRLGHQINW